MPTKVEIRLLGRLRLVVDGSDVTDQLRARKAGALLALLAYRMPEAVSREVLADALWPDADLESQRNRLSIALTTLRKALQSAGENPDTILAADRHSVRLLPERVSTDIAEFDSLTRAANPESQRAAELYRGPLYADGEEGWIEPERARRAGQFVRLARQLAEGLADRGDAESAAGLLRRALEAEPFDEEVHRGLLRVLISSGRSADALLHYRNLQRMLREELDIAPSPETRQLVARLKEVGRDAAPPAPRSAKSQRIAPSDAETVAPAESEKSGRPLLSPKRALLAIVLAVVGMALIIWSSRSLPNRTGPRASTSTAVEPGRQLWTARYVPKPDELNSEPTAITTDDAGNIYVTGFVRTRKSDVDILTLKYSPDGKPLWRSRYNGAANDCDRAYALAVDHQGNVYVAGESYNGDREKGKTQWDMTLIKLDANGNPLWSRHYNGRPSDDDRAIAVGVDDAGYPYVCGWSRDPKGVPCLVALKYSPNGAPIWGRRFDHPAAGAGQTSPWGMALDGGGNMYVTGEALLATLPGEKSRAALLTLRYDRSGNLLWHQFYEADVLGGARGRCVALAPGGGAYAAGVATNVADMKSRPVDNLVVIHYDADGKDLGVVERKDVRVPNSLTGIAVDRSGHVAVTGRKVDGTFLAAGFDAVGKLRWEDRIDATEAITHEARTNVVMDGAGHVCCTTFGRGREGGSCVATKKFRQDGHVLWSRTYEGPRPGHHQGVTLAVDRMDNVITAAQSYGGKTQDLVLLKYAP